MPQNKNTSNSLASLLVSAMGASRQRTAEAIIARQSERAKQDGSLQKADTHEKESPIITPQQPAF